MHTRFGRDLFIAALTSGAILVIATYLPHARLLAALATNPAVSIGEQWSVIASLALSLPATAGAFGTFIISAASILIGINAALLRRSVAHSGAWKGAGAGIGLGAIAAMIGSACAACGFLLVAGSAAGTLLGSALVLFPHHGKEFGVGALAILAVTAVLLSRNLRRPLVCPPQPRRPAARP